MVQVTPSGDMGWVEDGTPGPAELAELREEADRAWSIAHYVQFGEPPVRYVMGAGATWGERITRYETAAACPVCGNRRPPPDTACLCCNASHRNPRRHPAAGTPIAAPGVVMRSAVRKASLRGGRG